MSGNIKLNVDHVNVPAVVQNIIAGKILVGQRIRVQDVLSKWTFGIECRCFPQNVFEIEIALENFRNSGAVRILVKHVERNIIDTVK
jgi:hypothetical protein